MLSRCFLQFGHTTSLPIFNEWQRKDIDGPIFDKNSAFLAYFLLIHSKYNLSTVFREMKPFFDFINSMKVEQSRISGRLYMYMLLLVSY